MGKASRPHDDAVVELLHEDPAFADEYPITEAGSGSVQEKEKVYMAEIIEKVNSRL